MKNFPWRRILVPTDLSPRSRDAWDWANQLRGRHGSCEALFVYDPPLVPVLGLPTPPLSRTLRNEMLKKLRDAFPRATVRVEVGDRALTIVRRARHADLVMMASHGRRGLDRALLGSICEAVVRESPTPVLVVRGKGQRVRSVLAPVNLSSYARKGLLFAAEAAAYFGAELTILNVAEEKTRVANPRFFLSSALSRLPTALRRAIKPKILLRTGDPVREILEESRRHGLLVLAAHRKSLFSDLVLGMTVERVLRHARCPVLAIPSGG